MANLLHDSLFLPTREVKMKHPWLRSITLQIGCLAVAVMLLGDTTAYAQGGELGESLSSILGAAPTARSSTSYAGQTFNPLTTRGRAGSAMPAFREARLREAPEVLYEPGTAHETIVGPTFNKDVVYDSGPMMADPDCDCGDDCDMCGECGGCGECGVCCECCECSVGCEWDICDDDRCVPLCLPRLRFFSLFAGVHAFKGPRDNGFGNNFGFQEGVNVGGRVPFLNLPYFGYQLGYQSTQSRLHGDLVAGSTTVRRQHLATAGVYHRRRVGFQWGVVYDIMRDDFVQELDFSQVRAEASLVGPRGGEIGFLTAIHTNDAGYLDGGQRQMTFQAVDQYLLFYRWHFCECGEGRLWCGMTENSDGLFGGDVLLPINDRWSLSGGFNYLIPHDDTFPNGAIDESWNLAVNLVWHPRGDACTSHSSPFRPLFNVVDNGTMLLHQTQP